MKLRLSFVLLAISLTGCQGQVNLIMSKAGLRKVATDTQASPKPSSSPSSRPSSSPSSTPPDGTSAGCSHEPSGYAVIEDQPWDTVLPPGWVDDFAPEFSRRGSIVSNSSGPLSPSNAVAGLFPSGATGGNGPFSVYHNFPTDKQFKNLYICLAMMHSANFDNTSNGQNGGTKFFWPSSIGYQDNSVFSYFEDDVMEFGIFQQGTVNRKLPPNVGANATANAQVGDRKGKWVVYEVLLKASTSDGASDGGFDAWVDGVWTHHYTDVNWIMNAARTWLTFAWNPTYGWGTGNVPHDQTETIDHIRLSGSDTTSTPPSSDDALILTGSGFGTKSNAAPTYYSGFESETVGDHASSAIREGDSIAGLTHLQTSGVWSEGVSNVRGHSGSKSLRVTYGNGDGFPNLGVKLPKGSQTAYSSGWYYPERVAGSSDIKVWKWGRMGANAPYSGIPRFNYTIGVAGPVTDVSFTDGNNNNVYFQTFGNGFTTWPEDLIPLGKWAFVEALYKLSTPGVEDGYAGIWVNGIDTRKGQTQNFATRGSGVTDTIDWIITAFDGVSGLGSGTKYNLYGDEIYLDSSLARVVVTDNASYDHSTKFAAQPVSSWSNTQITIDQPNWGNFGAGAAFAHVWDAAGKYVGAFSVTVP
jgi:hypothetical protein